MQHAPINNPARYRLEKFGMRNAPERLLDRLPTTALIISTAIPIR